MIYSVMDDDDYCYETTDNTMRNILIGVVILYFMWVLSAPAEGYKPCIGDCPNPIPRKIPAVINPYVWPYSGASCMEDLYLMDRNVRGNSTSKPLVSLNTPDHTVLSTVSYVV